MEISSLYLRDESVTSGCMFLQTENNTSHSTANLLQELSLTTFSVLQIYRTIPASQLIYTLLIQDQISCSKKTSETDGKCHFVFFQLFKPKSSNHRHQNDPTEQDASSLSCSLWIHKPLIQAWQVLMKLEHCLLSLNLLLNKIIKTRFSPTDYWPTMLPRYHEYRKGIPWTWTWTTNFTQKV